MCSDALAEVGCLPTQPGPVPIDRFIEKRFRVPVIFERLSSGILGFTEFGPNGVVAVHVAEPDERTKSGERRVNSTLAHEGGHGLMHAHLFALGEDHGSLFDGDGDVGRTKVMCRDGETGHIAQKTKRPYHGRWWEFQANLAIGALLLPKDLFLQFMAPLLERKGSFGVASLPDSRRTEAIQAVAEAFDVNPAAAKVRLDTIFPPGSQQLTL